MKIKIIFSEQKAVSLQCGFVMWQKKLVSQKNVKIIQKSSMWWGFYK